MQQVELLLAVMVTKSTLLPLLVPSKFSKEELVSNIWLLEEEEQEEEEETLLLKVVEEEEEEVGDAAETYVFLHVATQL